MTPTWTLTFPTDQFLSSPAIASDGTVYIAGIKGDVSPHANQRRLYAINPNGTTKWTAYVGTRLSTLSDLKFDKGGECSPAIAADGTIYIGSWDYNLYAIKPDGTTKWIWNGSTATPKGVMRASPVIGPDGRIYCFVDADPQNSSSKAFLAKFQDNGTSATRLWIWDGTLENPTNPIKGNALASPALGRDGVIYIATHDEPFAGNPPAPTARRGWVYAINATSDTTPVRKWTFPGGNDCVGPIASSPVIDASGRLYVGTKQAFDGASNMSPEVISIDPTSGNTTTAPNTYWVYSTSENPDLTTGGPIEGTLAMNSLGQLLVPVDAHKPESATPESRLIAFDSITASQDWVFPVGGLNDQAKADSAPVVAADGSVFIKILSAQTSQVTLFKLDVVDGHDVDSAVVDFDISDWHASPFETAHGIDAPFSSVAIAPDGKLYCAVTGLAANGGKLFCFSTGIPGYSFWSKFRGNTFNTGDVQDNGWTAKTLASTTASITVLYSYPISGENKAYAASSAGKGVGYYPGTSQFGGGLPNPCNWPTTAGSPGSGNYPSLMTQPPMPPEVDGRGCWATGINDISEAVGSQNTSAGFRAVYWPTPSGTAQVVATPDDFSHAEALAISRFGVIVGVGTNTSGVPHALRWASKDAVSGDPIDLGTFNELIASLQSFAYAVNRTGWTVGRSQVNANGAFNAFAMPKEAGSIADGVNLSSNSSQEGPYSEAYSMNGLGQISGTSAAFPSTPQHAYIWLINTDGSITTKDLGTLTGGGTTGGSSINNRGHVVGWARKADNSLSAFIWMPGWTSIRELKSFLSTTDQNAWTELTAATAITDDGAVVGYGKRSGVSYYTGFVIRPK
jgi:hypothetical protein